MLVLNRLSKFQSNLLLLFVCILSRLITSIFYVEDIDSLRFALAIQDYSIINLQPHFPGYPIFCLFTKIIFFFTNNMGITFSLLGGISIYIIIYFILRLANVRLDSRVGLFCSAMIFFNPLLWIMSNRYMPDLFGAAVALIAMYFLVLDKDFKRNGVIGTFLVGILAGTRLSYLPLTIIPLLYVLRKADNKIYLLYTFILGIMIWLVPLVLITGVEDLLLAASKQTVGHFTDFGGTTITENNWNLRLMKFFSSIWADGMGGYWTDRHWITLIQSITFCLLIFSNVHVLVDEHKKNRMVKLMFYSMLVYAAWVLLFQNVIYKSRHVIPIIIIVLFLITNVQGVVFWEKISSRLISVVYLISLVSITVVLVIQHKNPTAISQLKDDLITIDSKKTIITIPLVKYYLETHGINANYINLNKLGKNNFQNNINEAILIGSHSKLSNNYGFRVDIDSVYYHNPYVNRMWSEIPISRLSKKVD